MTSSGHIRGRLNLRLGGFGAAAGSLEGEAEADIEVVATASDRIIGITISEPREANRMAAIICEQLFHTGRPRQFDFELSEQVYRMVGALSLVGPIEIALVSTETESSGTMITLHHESIPNDIELLVMLTTTAGRTRTEESEEDVPSDYSLLTPNLRAFAAGGYGRFGGRNSLAGTAGVDVPLMYSTENPLAYVGLWLRGSVGTAGSGRLGGSAFVGLNLDRLALLKMEEGIGITS